MPRISLQTKILTLIISLILFVTVMLTVVYAIFESHQTEEQMGRQALRVATTISMIPAIRHAFETGDPPRIIQPLAEDIRKMVGSEFIVIGNKDGIRYSHPDRYKIGHKMVGGDNERALKNGEYYISKAVGTLGPSLRGKAPILNSQGEIIGIVSVGFLLEDIQSIIFKRVMQIGSIALIVLGVAIFGGILLARNIRKDTLGLEPHEISSLYRERNAILLSIKEGIISIDGTGQIRMINNSAKEMLGLTNHHVNQSINQVLPEAQMYEYLKTGKSDQDEEVFLKDRMFIVNRTPIREDKKMVGVVASFRDKTEVQKMLNTISEIRKYSEEMRAQTHEYTNKLYVLSGLLQLGHYNDAIQMLQSEMVDQNLQNKILFDQITDQTVQAILLGKVSVASEKKIEFEIDENSTLSYLPDHFEAAKVITIVGNLIDNAFDAVKGQKEREVSFFATDVGHDIVFEIADSGIGIPKEALDQIFEKGYSTKDGMNRGFGLTNVKQAVEDLGGAIEVQNQKHRGSIFSIYIPKVKGGRSI